MGENSNIEWTDHTFNPWIGCAKVSPGCKFCYAEVETFPRVQRGKGVEVWGVHGQRIVTSYSNWKKVLSWQRQAKKEGVRRRVFCLSMGDIFEDWKGQMTNHKNEPMWFNDRRRDADEVPVFSEARVGAFEHEYVPLTMDIVRQEFFKLIDMCPDLDFLLLTKRPENIAKMWSMAEEDKTVYVRRDNIWLGTSVEDQQRADERIPHLLKVKGLCKYIFLSMEPLLEAVHWICEKPWPTGHGDWKPTGAINAGLDWVIVGGESGSNKRQFNADWAREVRDRCKAARIAFFMKQMDKVQPIPEDLMIRQFPNQP